MNPPKKIKPKISKQPEPERTRIVPIQNDFAAGLPGSFGDVDSQLNPKPEAPTADTSSDQTFQLHIGPGTLPGSHKAAPKVAKTAANGQIPTTIPVAAPLTLTSDLKQAAQIPTKKIPLRAKTPLGFVKIWNTLEWIATSALIFAVLFLVMNFQSYQLLFENKWAKLTGTFKVDPYIQKEDVTNPTNVSQQPIPLDQSTDQNKKANIPPIDIEIAPPDERVIIPRINRNVPVVQVSTENLIKRDFNALESEIQGALRDGVVHYPGTAQPGEKGNVVITGHSSYFSFDPGRFKDVFALLNDVSVNDTIIVYYDQKKYKYQVYDKKIVTPDKIDILTQNGEDKLTLITCYPTGTNLKRLVLTAKPIQ